MAGTSQLGFASGFLNGFTGSLQANRDRARQQEEKQQQNALNAAKFLLDSGQVGDIADIQPLLGIAMPEVFGEKAAKAKAGQVDHAKTIGDILNKSLGPGSQGKPMLPGPAAQSAPPASPSAPTENPQPGGALDTGAPQAAPAALQSTPVTIPAVPPQRSSLAGVPLLTPEEVSKRAVERSIATEQQTIQAKVDLARRILPTLQAVDKTATLDDAMATVGIHLPTERNLRPQSVAGEMNGKPAFGIFDPATQSYRDPVTHEVLTGFTPRVTTGSTTFGADRESISREQSFGGKPFAQQSPEGAAKVNAEVIKRAGEKAGATTTARVEANAKGPLSSAQRFSALRDLQGDWRKADAPVKETGRQLQIMETGLKRFKEGDMNGGSQAVLVTFQKILDPNSVVRESEYDRSAEGVGLKQRMEGFIERLKGGGAGVPVSDLEAMVQTAREFVQGLGDYNNIERERITQAAKEAGLEPSRVFGVASAPTGGGGTGKAAPSTAGAVMKDGHLYINGQKID